MNNPSQLKRITGAGVIILLLLALAGCCIGFRASSPPAAPCPIEGLLLSTSIFPGTEWEEIGPPSSRAAPAEIGVERMGTSFSTPTNGGANHHVYRLFNNQEARKEYEHSVSTWFLQQAGETEWLTPTRIDLSQIQADLYQLKCSTFIQTGAEKCRYIAQHGPYLVEFSTDMLIISYDDLRIIVKDIDEKMTTCLLGS